MSVFRRAVQRRGTPADYLVVGLGNPGDKYLGTRHNLGYEVIEALTQGSVSSLDPSKRDQARVAVITHGESRIILACPTTFMNLSGEAVSSLVRRNGIEQPSRVLIVHDELDLESGRIKVKQGGSTAGHNGLKSIRQHIGTDDFVRIRMGVGKPPDPQQGRNWVLRKPSPTDRALLDSAVQVGIEAVKTVISSGVEQAMNEVNGRQP